MMGKSIFMAAASVALFAPAAAFATPASDLAANMASALQGLVGKQPDSPFTITSIKADSETLVISVDGESGWREDKSAADLSAAFVGGFCTKAASMFDSGMKLRVDTSENGGDKLWTGPTVDHCPAK